MGVLSPALRQQHGAKEALLKRADAVLASLAAQVGWGVGWGLGLGLDVGAGRWGHDVPRCVPGAFVCWSKRQHSITDSGLLPTPAAPPLQPSALCLTLQPLNVEQSRQFVSAALGGAEVPPLPPPPLLLQRCCCCCCMARPHVPAPLKGTSATANAAPGALAAAGSP